MITILIFSLAYSIKGGLLGRYKPFEDWRDANIPKFGGKFFSAFLMAVLFLVQGEGIEYALIWLVAWLLAVTPSMGEEAGAIGRWNHWWGDYRFAVYPFGHAKAGKQVFNRSYGVLKGVQRGAWMGAMFCCAGATTLSIPIMAIGFVAAHFLGQEAYYRIHKSDSWVYVEPVVGALLGLCYVFGG